ncbi:MAG: PBP1A family penicillin-binding protein [Pseudorhodoplanes sp.]|nr:PBP1A family penicillin-binding protein [Pseudorhodoplanes sp.]GIK79898.1 MAG: penicillin-binding protein [Alphaproteobacteria bacterium]
MPGWRRKRIARREPRFARPGAVLDVRLSAGDRPAPAAAGSVRRSSASSRGGSPRNSGGPGNKRRRGRSRPARVFYWGVVGCLWLAIAGFGAVLYIGAHLPPIQSLQVPKRPPSIKIAGLDGRVLVTRGDSGLSARLEDLPKYVPQAFIAIEDRRFYEHAGIDPRGVARAALANLLRRGVAQGGSTLTQQLAKNLFLNQERTLTRKAQELVLALWLERNFSKDEILALYLNRIYFGAGAYGIEAAAQRYFGKRARDLSLAEAAMLAGLVKSPSRLAPTRNPHAAEQRAQLVIAAMREQNLIDKSAASLALARPARVLRQTQAGSVNYIADWIMDVLDDLVGFVEDDIVVETSIDPRLQGMAEQAIIEELASKGEKAGVAQAAFVAMTPDGAVRAMVGGRNYAESQFNRAVAAKRQPGSAFKPFVYLTALERGLTPDTVREDKPIALKGWKPENYTREYFGPVTLTQALAMSLNTVAVRLTLEFGPTAVTRTAYRLGIASKLEPNPSIALGTSEVSLIELVSAYAPFANGGSPIIAHVVENVRRIDGTMLYQRTPHDLGQVIDSHYVGMMNAMMQETLISGTGRKADLGGYPAAGKTGTSQDFRDGWFVGYTAHLVAGVWFGNDDNSPTRKMTGSGLPAETWARVMKAAHRGTAAANLPGLSGRGLFPLPDFGRQTPPVASAAAPSPATKRGLDHWLIDGLFGRR